MGIATGQNLVNSIYSFISDSIGRSNPSGQLINVYELQAPDNTTLPVCVFTIISDVVTPALSKSISEEVGLQVNFFGKKSLGSKVLRTISDELFLELDRAVLFITGAKATVTGVIQNITTIEDGEVFNIRQEYKILIT